MVVRVSAAPVPSATTWLSAKRIPPCAVHVPEWTCETWDELGARPVICSSIVVLLPLLVTRILPLAVVLMPLSGNCSPDALGLAPGLGLAAELRLPHSR